MKKTNPLLIAGLGFAMLTAHAASAQESDRAGEEETSWTLDLGVGAMSGPEYLGSDDSEISALPYVGISWKDLIYLNVADGLGANLVQEDHLEFGISINYDGGRDNDGDLVGMDKIDSGAVGRVYGSYSFDYFSFGFETETYLGGGDGTTLTLSADFGSMPTEGLILTFGPSVTLGTGNYVTTNFGVTASEASRTGFSEYKPDAGLVSVDFGGSATYLLTENWNITGIASVGMLQGDAADSPIAKEDTYYNVGAILGYQFNW